MLQCLFLTYWKLPVKPCSSWLIYLLHILHFLPQVSCLNLSVSTRCWLQDSIVNKYILFLWEIICWVYTSRGYYTHYCVEGMNHKYHRTDIKDTCHSLHHLSSLLSQLLDDCWYVHNTFLINLLQDHINSNECPSSTNTSTEKDYSITYNYCLTRSAWTHLQCTRGPSMVCVLSLPFCEMQGWRWHSQAHHGLAMLCSDNGSLSWTVQTAMNKNKPTMPWPYMDVLWAIGVSFTPSVYTATLGFHNS